MVLKEGLVPVIRPFCFVTDLWFVKMGRTDFKESPELNSGL